MSKEKFIEKAHNIYGHKYDYTDIVYINCKIPIKIKCKKHGYFTRTPDKFINRKEECIDCSKSMIIYDKLKQFIEKAKQIHNNKYTYDDNYNKINYKSNKSKIKIFCDTCQNYFLQQAQSHLSGCKCPNCFGSKKYNNDMWIEKAKEVHSNKYDYSKVEYKDAKTKVIITCINHGDFKQLPINHFSGGNCPKCSIKINSDKQRFTIEQFIEKATEIHGDKYDYSKVNYLNAKTKVIIICKKHGEFNMKPDYHIRGNSGCQKCNYCPSCQLWRTWGKLCEYCKPKSKNKLYQKTKEYAVVKYLKEKLPDYDFIHNKSVGSECTKNDKQISNGHLFPDIIFDCDFYHLIVEVDEHKHRAANYKCEEQRMYNIIAKLGLPCIFIRYNPDSKESNKDILLNKIQKYFDIVEQDTPWDDYGFMVEYLFY